jgi:hypothetical protein
LFSGIVHIRLHCVTVRPMLAHVLSASSDFRMCAPCT